MKSTVISILIAGILIVGAFIFSNQNNDSAGPQDANNINIVNGKQIITIDAKGGYYPRITNAKADMPTVIKMNTKSTFDCSSAINIPSLGYSNNLPPTGETIIDVPAQKTGATIQGICSMGMYSFSINFN
jgi:plastocyanin domain-containing protein